MTEISNRSAETLADGFDRVYHREIAPHQAELEAGRQGRLRAFYRRIGLSVPILAAIAGGLYTIGFLPDQPVWSAVILIVGAVLAGVWISRPAIANRDAMRAVVIEPICRHLGDMAYSRKGKEDFELFRFEDNDVVGNYNRAELEDLFSGHHRDTGFRVVEARLKRRRVAKRSSSRTVFKGLLFDIEVPQPFTCHVLLASDKGGLVNRVEGFFRDKFGGMEAVSFDHPAFEARFEVYSDDPAAARGLMTPALLDSLVALAEAAEGRTLKAAFADGRFLLALPNREDLFEIGKLHRALDHLKEDVETLLRQITLPHRVIDFLHGERPELMP